MTISTSTNIHGVTLSGDDTDTRLTSKVGDYTGSKSNPFVTLTLTCGGTEFQIFVPAADLDAANRISLAINGPKVVEEVDLVAGVKAMCGEKYENGWCDLVIETMSDNEISEVIKGARTVSGAFKKLGQRWGAYAERRREVQSEAF